MDEAVDYEVESVEEPDDTSSRSGSKIKRYVIVIYRKTYNAFQYLANLEWLELIRSRSLYPHPNYNVTRKCLQHLGGDLTIFLIFRLLYFARWQSFLASAIVGLVIEFMLSDSKQHENNKHNRYDYINSPIGDVLAIMGLMYFGAATGFVAAFFILGAAKGFLSKADPSKGQEESKLDVSAYILLIISHLKTVIISLLSYKSPEEVTNKLLNKLSKSLLISALIFGAGMLFQLTSAGAHVAGFFAAGPLGAIIAAVIPAMIAAVGAGLIEVMPKLTSAPFETEKVNANSVNRSTYHLDRAYRIIQLMREYNEIQAKDQTSQMPRYTIEYSSAKTLVQKIRKYGRNT